MWAFANKDKLSETMNRAQHMPPFRMPKNDSLIGILLYENEKSGLVHLTIAGIEKFYFVVSQMM